MSDSKTTEQSLFHEFPPVSTEEWEQKVKQDLKGADYKEKLRWETGEGVSPLPFYRREDFEEISRKRPLEKAGDHSWQIREPVFEQDIADANKAAREALDHGTGGLQFYLQVLYTDGMLGGDLAGTAIQNQQHFSDLFKDINLSAVPVSFDSGLATPVLLAMLWNEVSGESQIASDATFTFSYDPFRSILLNGRLPKEVDDFQHDIVQMGRFCSERLPGVRPLCIDARTYHNTGATLVEELGFALASASEYLAILTDQGLDATRAGNRLTFTFSIGSNYFLEIAKFRAMRLLWEQLLQAYGADPEQAPAHLGAETSRRNKTLYDPYNNMLRSTTEGMSAVLGGCDALTVLPFDSSFRRPDNFSRRIARNTQIIMSEEAYLDRVKDPAAGSYYIEQLTEDIARKGWSFFQEVEQVGGMTKAIRENFVQLTIEGSQKERSEAAAKRKRVFVGTNKYPNPEDRMAEKYRPDQPTVSLDSPEGEPEINENNLIPEIAGQLAGDADLKDFIPYLFDISKHDIRQLQSYHEAEGFEKLRLATEQHERTPVVCTLPVGDRRMRKARSSFASNFFGCAGYEIEDPIGYDAPREGLSEIIKQSPDIVVLCSSDEEYEEMVPVVGDVFAEMEDRPLFVVAGSPGEKEAAYRDAGVDDFIHSQSDVLGTLREFHNRLGIKDA